MPAPKVLLAAIVGNRPGSLPAERPCASSAGAFQRSTPTPAPVRCHKCDDHCYDLATAVGIYEKGISAAVLELKRTPHLPHILHELTAERLTHVRFDHVDVIIPTPLSKLRQIERGFNQAEVVAKMVSRIIRKPVDAHTLARTVHTPIHRIGMDQRARELTLQNAFDVHRPKLIHGKNVLIVDDVFTSGSTASLMAAVLKKSGAARVDVFTLARAVLR